MRLVRLVVGTLVLTATYGVADPDNVELPPGDADHGNRVGSFTVDATW